MVPLRKNPMGKRESLTEEICKSKLLFFWVGNDPLQRTIRSGTQTKKGSRQNGSVTSGKGLALRVGLGGPPSDGGDPPGDRREGGNPFPPGPREAASAGTGAATTRKGKAALPAGGLLGTPGFGTPPNGGGAWRPAFPFLLPSRGGGREGPPSRPGDQRPA